MSYEQSKFGDGSAAGAGNVTQTVSNHFNARATGKTSGTVFTQGNTRETSWDIDAEMLSNGAFPLIAPTFKAGTLIERVTVEVQEAFVLGGTSPTIEVGTEGSEATNGVTITEAQAEAAGVYDVTSALAGTWSSGALAAATTVGVALGGTSPTVTTAGTVRVVVRYISI